jgi:hypothetical protein
VRRHGKNPIREKPLLESHRGADLLFVLDSL